MNDFRVRAATGYNRNQAWQDERDYAISQFREYVDNNNPPILSDLIKAMERVTPFGFATLTDLITIVNAKIHPFKLVEDNSKPRKYKHVRTESYAHYLKLIDTNETVVAGSLLDPTTILKKRGDFAVHQVGCVTSYRLELLPLTPKEHRVLAALLSSSQVVSFDMLFDAYWVDGNEVDDQFLDSPNATKARKQQLINNCIGSIRKTLKMLIGAQTEPIKTRPKIGYEFVD